MNRCPYYKPKKLHPQIKFARFAPYSHANRRRQGIGNTLLTLTNFIYNYPSDTIEQILNGNEDAFDRSWVQFYNNIVPYLCQLCTVCTVQSFPSPYTAVSPPQLQMGLGGQPNPQLSNFIHYLLYQFGPELLQGQTPVLSIEQLINELPKLVKQILDIGSLTNLTT